MAAPAVGAYIGAAYWFTSSTSFANPAVTVGRIFSDTFAGIAPSSAPWVRGGAAGRFVVGVAITLALYPDAARAPTTSSSLTRSIELGLGLRHEHYLPSKGPVRGDHRGPSLYSYEGIFSSQSVAAAVDAARLALEPASTVQTYLPVLVARQAPGNS